MSSSVSLAVRLTMPCRRMKTLLASPKYMILSLSLPCCVRSEEHTTELQSQSNLVCRLLLEKNRSRHLPSRLSVILMQSGPHFYEIAATESITRIILLMRIRSSILTVVHTCIHHLALIDILK